MTKRCVVLLAALIPAPMAAAADKPKANDARRAVEEYMAAVLAGRTEVAAGLAVKGQSPAKPKNIKEMRKLLGGKNRVKIATVIFSAKKDRACAVSETVTLTKANPDKRNTGVLSFKLDKVKGKWLVRDIDFDTADKAKTKTEDFKKQNPDAKEIPAKSKE